MNPVTSLRPHQIRGVDAMSLHAKGQLLMPTGAGKTLCMINYSQLQFQSQESKTIIVVAPRILLASQLCSEFLEEIQNASVMHVHTGETEHFRSTNPKIIRGWNVAVPGHKIIFTTYHSLSRIQEANIHVDVIYFDEAHNSVKKNFFPATEYFSHNANRCYFLTATPKHSTSLTKPGMNDAEVYGQIICNVPAPELVQGGFIVPPSIQVNELNLIRDKQYVAERDCMTLLDTILNEDNMEKVLVAAPNTKVLIRMLAETDFLTEIRDAGYEVLWITSKYGAFINQKKVSREEFFNTLTKWGRSSDKKFVLLHYSILSEGINCPGLTSCVLMRDMDPISMAQTLGRIIRLHPEDSRRLSEGSLTPGKLEDYVKSYGFVHVPVYQNSGKSTAKKIQSVSDTIFVKGEPAISVIK
jgi:superfamily II DNA or RNA helicase